MAASGAYGTCGRGVRPIILFRLHDYPNKAECASQGFFIAFVPPKCLDSMAIRLDGWKRQQTTVKRTAPGKSARLTVPFFVVKTQDDFRQLIFIFRRVEV